MGEGRKDEVTGQTTTGHKYDGIEELNTPMPRWWLWTFYITIVWGIGYSIAYPAWPLISGATQGLLGWSTRADVAHQIETHAAANAKWADALIAVDLEDLDAAGDLHRYAFARGRSVFAAHCSQCHGSGAAGTVGYPNLLDNDWLWGGSLPAITYTIRHGIRNATDDAARYSQMPAFGDILQEPEIADLTGYVRGLSDPEAVAAPETAALFANNCASCHGEAGQGDRVQGAPNLGDAIWLYGKSDAAISDSITNARFGVMPAWGQRLSEIDVRAVAVYVHALGGGE